MKKFFLLILTLLILTSCQKTNTKVDIIVTIYPFKFIIDEIVKNQLEVDVLLPSSVDPHTYELVPSDLMKVQQADIFIYGDKDLDGWAAKIETENKIQFSDLVPDSLRLDISEPLFHQTHHHSHSHSHTGFDPHFWTDPMTVYQMIPNIVELLIKYYPEKKNVFLQNAELFKAKLLETDKSVRLQTEHIPNKNIFSSHPFYNYFFHRYNFNVIGFLEISPGQNLSPKEMKQMMELVNDNNVKAIFTNKQHNDRTTKILAESVGIKYYDLDPIGGTEELNSYLKIIAHNLEIIKNALR